MTDTTGTEPFRFTDADGDYLHIGIPTSPTTGHPAISFCTLAEPVHVPMEQIEGLITALRRLVAAQSAVSPAAVEPPADQTTPSHRAGLRNEIAAALEAADYRMDMRRGDLADAVMPVLYREWPWLRAEAEDAAPPADRATVLRDAAEALHARAKHYTGEFNDSDILHEDGPAATVATWKRAGAYVRRMAAETATTQTQPVSTAPLAVGLPLVKGNCPACGGSLFLGTGGYVTCSRIDCPEPDAASTTLEQPAAGARQDGGRP